MTKRVIKQEKPSEEEVEEVNMLSSTKRKGKSRADPSETNDAEMMEAPSVSGNSFAAMPTPSSFTMDSRADTPVNGLRPSTAGGK
jgi:hypothetical protein